MRDGKLVIVMSLTLLIAATTASGQESERLSIIKDARLASEAGAVRLAACPATPLQLPARVTGTIGFASCTDILGLREDVYSITVAAGETIDIDLSSPDFDVFLYMYLGNGTSVTTTRVSTILTSPLSRVTARHTFATGGTYYVEAESLWSLNPGSLPWRGNYTLSISTSKTTAGSCVASSTATCLQNGRFRVSIAYLNQFATPPAPGTFLGGKLIAGPQNPDVATFGISSPQAIEVVVRIQDTRPFGLNRFDVYYGGLTDLEYTVSVTDTVTGNTKTYRNPPGTVGGGVDRTTFTAN
jgi:hypothetical protein